MTWQSVLDLRGNCGFTAGFDPEREYEFKRFGEDSARRFRLADQNPYFNIAFLMFRQARP